MYKSVHITGNYGPQIFAGKADWILEYSIFETKKGHITIFCVHLRTENFTVRTSVGLPAGAPIHQRA
jgi:hypothetical protein